MPSTVAEPRTGGSAWGTFGTASPRHLMLDPAYCIHCGACETACPWESIYAMPDESAAGDPERSAVYLIEDQTCTRCGLCVEVCPTDCLYFARLEESGETRTLGVVLFGGPRG